MLPSPEERKRMREEKAAQRAKRQAKMMRLRLIAAAVVLITCGVLIFAFAGKNSKPDTPNIDSTQSTAQGTTEASTTEPEKSPTTVIHYAAAGDLNINDATVASGGTGYVYTDTFIDVAHLLADADISSVNFEGTLTGEPYGSSASAPQSMALLP